MRLQNVSNARTSESHTHNTGATWSMSHMNNPMVPAHTLRQGKSRKIKEVRWRRAIRIATRASSGRGVVSSSRYTRRDSRKRG
jgi:hypothetical protein